MEPFCTTIRGMDSQFHWDWIQATYRDLLLRKIPYHHLEILELELIFSLENFPKQILLFLAIVPF